MHKSGRVVETVRIICLYCKTLGDSRRIDADRKRKSVRQINNEYMRIEGCIQISRFHTFGSCIEKSREIFVNPVKIRWIDMRFIRCTRRKWFQIPTQRRDSRGNFRLDLGVKFSVSQKCSTLDNFKLEKVKPPSKQFGLIID